MGTPESCMGLMPGSDVEGRIAVLFEKNARRRGSGARQEGWFIETHKHV
jgi:hypothetical protein